MGWSAGNDVFDPMARAFVEQNTRGMLSDDGVTELCVTLIRVLQQEDWDTLDESLEAFCGNPLIVEAFARVDVHPRGRNELATYFHDIFGLTPKMAGVLADRTFADLVTAVSDIMRESPLSDG